MLDPTKKKDTPHQRTKEKPQQDGRRGETAFRIKPHTCQRCSEGSNKTLCAPGPRGPKTMASGPITLWQIDGETETDFIFMGSKITADGY